MKKNALLTFIFACIPGAGQMYYGYMQRGLSLITLFCASFMLGALAGPLVVTMFIVWMFSFFDTYDLIRHLAAGDPKPDSLLLLGDWEDLKRMVPKHNRLLGWGLIALGIWALYDMLLEPLLFELLYSLSPGCGCSSMQKKTPSPPWSLRWRSLPQASGCWGCTPSAATAAMCRPSPAATARSKLQIPAILTKADKELFFKTA